MNTIIQFFQQHPYISASITTWISTVGISAFITSLPAPTASSSQFYTFCFKFFNAVLAGNISRARSTAVENSPNFQAAVNVQTAQAGLPQIAVQPPTPKP